MLLSRLLKRRLLVSVTACGLIAAAIPASLSLWGLWELHTRIATINRATDLAAQARAVRNEITQALIGFTALTLTDLSPTERARLFEEAERGLAKLTQFSEASDAFVELLSRDQLNALNEAISGIARSWMDLRGEFREGLSDAQKSFHFLTAFENVTVARAVLGAAELRATNDARLETRFAFGQIATHFGWVIAIVLVTAGLGAGALLLVLRAAAQARATNVELAVANRELIRRQAEIDQSFEALQRAKEAAEAASRAKSAFLAMVTHELRTPLNAVVGFSEMMAKESMGPLGNGQYREFAGLIHSSGRHLTVLITDILDFAKADAGQLELADEIINIEAIVNGAVSWLRPHAEQANLTVEVELPSGLPDLRGDERRIKQILLNLLSNAVKFTPAGGQVTIGAEHRANGDVALFVRDTGIGIEPENLSKAFEPFGQIDAKLERKYEGAGLGLPLVKALTELHGGRIEVHSGVGAGTSLTVIFPASRLVDAAAQEAVRTRLSA
jgi:signal transduction histidine kinase